MSQKKTDNLDSLMMAYANLSVASKSSFKGPPLKEVKVQKQEAPAFKPSSKARDWSCFEQALEDAFVVAPVQSEASINVDWEKLSAPSSSSQAVNDDWGDFQDFQSPTGPPQVTEAHKIDDEFADFVSASFEPTKAVESSDLFTAVSVTSTATVFTSNTIGQRLASFQEESPVHNFRGINTVGTQPVPDFETTFAFEPSTSSTFPTTVLPTAPIISQEVFGQTPTASTKPQTHFSSQGRDKYSALDDLLSLSEFEPTLKSNEPLSIHSEETIDSKIVHVPDLGHLEDDFGDFVAVQTEDPPPVSVSRPYAPKSSVIPVWHETSPPPMPSDDFHNNEEILEIPSSDVDVDVTAICSQSFESKVEPFVPPSAEFVDFQEISEPSVIDDRVEEPTCALSEKFPPTTVEAPSNVDVLPLDFHQLKSPNREWSQALIQIHELLTSAGDTLSNISDDNIMLEVLGSPEGVNYLKNLIEVFRVFKRIHLSYSMAVYNETVQRQCEAVEKAWKRLVNHSKSKVESLVPSRDVFDFSRCLIQNPSRSTACGLCLLSLSENSKETSDVVPNFVVSYEGSSYHSSCANFWMNCVSVDLPKIV